jgi:V/A-type H+/Na+-transporting ATPase subunit E
MGLDSLKQELKKKTAAEVLRIENEARMESRRLKDEARKEIDRRHEQGMMDAQDAIAREKMRIPAARLRAKRIIQEARYGLVSKAMDALIEEMEGMRNDRKEYEKFLEMLIRQGISELGEKNATIAVRKQDLQFARKFGKAIELECLGGALISSENGKVRINNTFEALIDGKRAQLEQLSFELMFGKPK